MREMEYQFIINTLIFLIIMGSFFILTDYFILNNIEPIKKRLIERRWVVGIVLGVVILYYMYGRHGP